MNMPLSVLNRRRRTGAAATPAFSPSLLFASSEPGVWYDPSDLTTLFQDTAGTTPVTTPGQAVALMLDKSKGLALSSTDALAGNGDFSTPSYWVDISGVSTISGGQLTFNGSATVGGKYVANKLVLGKYYQVTFAVSSIASGGVQIFLGTERSPTYTATTAGAHTFRSACVGDSGVRIYNNGTATSAVIDNVVIRELAGNHATQATAASRPTYGVVPLGGRRNQFLFSEQFSSAVWVKSSVTPLSEGFTITTTAEPNISQAVTVASGSVYTHRLQVRYVDAQWFRIFYTGAVSGSVWFDVLNGVVGTSAFSSATISDADVDGWRTVTVVTPASSTTTLNVYYTLSFSNGNAAEVTGTIGARKNQLETGSTATAYQRVSTAFDVTEAGVQSLSYLSFDGVDDFMVTGTITPGTDKAQVFAGVRKLSDAAESVLTEFSAASQSNAGSFGVFAPPFGSTGYAARFRGSAAVSSSALAASSFTGATTTVLALYSDIPADNMIMRANASQVAQSTVDQGTGNFGNYPLYIGRRGGTTLPFSGQIYSLITRFGANLDTTAITNTETWVNARTGAF